MLLKPTLKVRLFGLLKIPLIAYARPAVERLDEEQVTIRIPLRRRTMNHWKSMYFGALAIGADLAAGSHALFAADAEKARSGRRVDLIFKDCEAQFLRRQSDDVFFTSTNGKDIAAAVAKAADSGERINVPVPITCTSGGEEVAKFVMTVSLKRKN